MGGGCRVSAETQVGQAPKNPHPRGIGADLKVLVGGRGPGSFLDVDLGCGTFWGGNRSDI